MWKNKRTCFHAIRRDGMEIMTNRQWLMKQMQNMSDGELCNMLQKGTRMIVPADKIDVTRGLCICNWLKSEHKEPIKLSDAERVILENAKGFKWICRDKSGYLYLYSAKPFKNGTIYRGWNTEQRIDEDF